RNRLKIQATINNAKQFLEIRKEFDSFDKYIWQFVGGKPIKHRFQSLNEIPATTRESNAMSKDLLERGLRFVGPTICYAFMQAVGRRRHGKRTGRTLQGKSAGDIEAPAGPGRCGTIAGRAGRPGTPLPDRRSTAKRGVRLADPVPGPVGGPPRPTGQTSRGKRM